MNKIIPLIVVSLLLTVSRGIDTISGYEETAYDLVIIAPAKFISNLEPLEEHKNTYGVKTLIINVEAIYDHYEGRDTAEQIKYFIKDAIDQWDVDYILLVGGRAPSVQGEKWLLPVRYSNIVDNWMTPEKRYISDLYFADIYNDHGDFQSWDTNQNDIFGEWLENESAYDIVDMVPDVYIGRLPCRNTFEVDVMVDKIMEYETGKCADVWFRKFVAVAGDTYTDNDYFEGENAAEEALNYMSDFTPIRLFTSDNSFTGPFDVIRTINQGCGFLLFMGHGSPTAWGTNKPYDDSGIIFGLKLPHMLWLRNQEKLPICLVGGCHNSMFNVSIFHDTEWNVFPVLECWSWFLTHARNGGSIATIGCTGLGYGKEDKHNPELGGGGDYLNVLFFREFAKGETDYLGEVWGHAITSYLDEFTIDWDELGFSDTGLDAKTVQEWILFGDPSLKIGGYE